MYLVLRDLVFFGHISSLCAQEVTVPFQAQSLQMFNEKLCVGYQSGFSLFHVYNDEKPQCKPRPSHTHNTQTQQFGCPKLTMSSSFSQL